LQITKETCESLELARVVDKKARVWECDSAACARFMSVIGFQRIINGGAKDLLSSWMKSII
jgi:hypothetical protein